MSKVKGIKITPQMLEAGMREYDEAYGWSDSYEPVRAAEFLQDAFTAMASVSPSLKEMDN